MTAAAAILVFVLSICLRRREITTIRKIGAPRSRLLAIFSAEILMVVAASTAIAAALTALLSRCRMLALQLVIG
jgi:ABC-type antimicrobial peptide transport system permease subunit